MVRGRHAGVVRDFQSTPTVQQKPGTTGGADSVRTASRKQWGKVRVVTKAGVRRVWEVEGSGRRRRGRWGEKFTVKGDKITRQGDGEGEREREKQFVRGYSARAYSIPSCKWDSQLILFIFC